MKTRCTLLTLSLVTLMGAAPALTFQTTTASVRQADHGHLASNGEVAEYIAIPQTAEYTVSVVAAGMVLDGVWPVMALRLNGSSREEVSVGASTYETYQFATTLQQGVHRVGVAFLNDDSNANGDRNLLLSTLSVDPPAGVSEPTLSSEAAWQTSMGQRETLLVAQSEQAIADNRMSPAQVKVLDNDGAPVQNASVAVEQVTHDFLFGANLFGFDIYGTPQQNETYKQLFADLFNYATVPLYWSYIEPVQGQPDYALIDAMVQWAQQNGIAVKGHAVLYGDPMFVPEWTGGSPSWEMQQARLADVLGRYAGSIARWDLVNEPYNAPGMQFGPAYQWADNYDANADLIVNSYGQFNTDFAQLFGDAHRGFYEFLDESIAQDIPFDTIGIQAHAPLDTAFPLETVLAHLDRYAQLGKDIHITEFTPCANGQPVLGAPWRAGVWDEAMQAEYAEAFYRICFSHPAVKAISWWDFADTGSWLAEGGMLREDLSAKPVYDALYRLIHEEWRTGLEGLTYADGKYYFTGFHGRYRIVVNYGDQQVEAEFHLAEDGGNVFEVRLDGLSQADTTPPVITLNGPATVYVEAGETYEDAGATALDDVDGDITDSIQVDNRVDTSKTGLYPVYYRVWDAAGNASERVTRNVLVEDTAAPIITLNGSATVSVEQYKTFTDPGATAADSVDGDLSDAIEVSGAVNTATRGTYTLTYNVSDAAGNAATAVTRTVTVTKPSGTRIGVIGDLDSDGQINSWDGTLLYYTVRYGESWINFILRMRGMNKVDARLADLDRDGSVNSWDLEIFDFVMKNGLEATNDALSSQGLPLARVGEELWL